MSPAERKVPKHIAVAFEAARAVLGDRVRLDFHPRAKHRWRMVCGKAFAPMSGTPKNREDEARYARQWAQRTLREIET